MDKYKKPFLYVWPVVYVICIAPWYLFGKFVLRLDIQFGVNLEAYAISIFCLTYVLQVIGNLKVSKLTEEERETFLDKKIFSVGKIVQVFISIKAAVILMFAVLAMVAYISLK
jgi:hypothetical protein